MVFWPLESMFGSWLVVLNSHIYPRYPTAPTGLLPSAAAVVLARLPLRCHLRAGPPARVDPHSVQRKLSDAAAPPIARLPCLLQCAALCATARLSQKC
jgi:hypothetical protein